MNKNEEKSTPSRNQEFLIATLSPKPLAPTSGQNFEKKKHIHIPIPIYLLSRTAGERGK